MGNAVNLTIIPVKAHRRQLNLIKKLHNYCEYNVLQLFFCTVIPAKAGISGNICHRVQRRRLSKKLRSMNINAINTKLNSPSLAKGCPKGGVVAL
jgi:hypothetical protein